MNIEQDILVRQADWHGEQDHIRRIRHQVFVVEQNVDPELEWDGLDSLCVHALLFEDDDAAVATGRLAADGKVGRMAVLAEYRGRGYGGKILDFLIGEARTRNIPGLYLHAQTHAAPFYLRHGFEIHGPEFDEASIPHRLMRRPL